MFFFFISWQKLNLAEPNWLSFLFFSFCSRHPANKVIEGFARLIQNKEPETDVVVEKSRQVELDDIKRTTQETRYFQEKHKSAKSNQSNAVFIKTRDFSSLSPEPSEVFWWGKVFWWRCEFQAALFISPSTPCTIRYRKMCRPTTTSSTALEDCRNLSSTFRKVTEFCDILQNSSTQRDISGKYHSISPKYHKWSRCCC